MKSLDILTWLFPILFMFQDFEEIIMINPWKKRYEKYINEMKGKSKYIPYPFNGTTAAFSIAVFLEFIFITVVCAFSYIYNNYIIWLGLFIGFVLHLFGHIFLSIKFKKYVPGITTSLILIPICILLLKQSKIFSLLCFKSILVSIVISSIIILCALYLLHKLVKRFDLWLISYSKNI